MAKEKFDRSKPYMNIGAVGYIGKDEISGAIPLIGSRNLLCGKECAQWEHKQVKTVSCSKLTRDSALKTLTLGSRSGGASFEISGGLGEIPRGPLMP